MVRCGPKAALAVYDAFHVSRYSSRFHWLLQTDLVFVKTDVIYIQFLNVKSGPGLVVVCLALALLGFYDVYRSDIINIGLFLDL